MSQHETYEMRWTGKALEPCTKRSIEAFEGTPKNTTMLVQVKRPRNIQHHRKFFALLKIVIDAGGFNGSEKSLLHLLKLECDEFDLLYLPYKGEYLKIPNSISFASMGQERFEKFYDKALDFCCEKLLCVPSHILETEVSHEISPTERLAIIQNAQERQSRTVAAC